MNKANLKKMGLGFILVTSLSLSPTAFGGSQVPIKGEFATHFQFTTAPPVVTLIVTGQGQVSHLGRSTLYTDNETVDFLLGGKLTGTLTLTAANGDTLVGEMDGWAIPDFVNNAVTLTGTLTFTGGTGRFQDAAGSASFSGGAAPMTGPSGPGWFSIEGKVSSPGASKK